MSQYQSVVTAVFVDFDNLRFGVPDPYPKTDSALEILLQMQRQPLPPARRQTPLAAMGRILMLILRPPWRKILLPMQRQLLPSARRQMPLAAMR